MQDPADDKGNNQRQVTRLKVDTARLLGQNRVRYADCLIAVAQVLGIESFSVGITTQTERSRPFHPFELNEFVILKSI